MCLPGRVTAPWTHERRKSSEHKTKWKWQFEMWERQRGLTSNAVPRRTLTHGSRFRKERRTLHFNCTHRTSTNENTIMFGTILSLCVSVFQYLCCFGPKYSTPAKGLRIATSLVTLQGAVLCVLGAWTRHDRDPERDENASICFCHETMILRVVGRLMNPALGCTDTKSRTTVRADVQIHDSPKRTTRPHNHNTSTFHSYILTL